MKYINKETYTNFFEAIGKEINRLENELSHCDMEDLADYPEINGLDREIEYFAEVMKYFSDVAKWDDFNTVEELEDFVKKSKAAYDSLTEYLKTVLWENGGELIGISYREFDRIDAAYLTLGEQVRNWSLFLNFCKTGELE